MLKISLDKVDVKILEILQEQGDISNVELSKKVGLSPSPCLARVRFLKSEGYNPLLTEDPIWVQLPKETVYQPMTETLFTDINRGNYSF